MAYANVEYLADSMIMETFLRNGSVAKYAQSGLVGSLAQGIREYVLSQFDKNHPVSSIMAFLGPGLLWRVSPMMGIFYEVAAALGFDWKGFWQSVGENLKEFLEAVFSGGQKPSEQLLSSKINSAVDISANEHFKDNPNDGVLESLKRKFSFKQELNNVIELKSIINKYKKDKTIIKHATAITSKLARFFIRTIKWLIKTALISLGLTVGGGAASTLLGTNPAAGQESSATTTSISAPTIPMSESVSPDLMTWHRNDMRSAWLERGESSQISNILLSWVLNAYPQLKSNISQLKSSHSFTSVVDRFMSRNRLGEGLGIFSVPHPYQKKIDIVNQIVVGFLQEAGSTSQQDRQPDQEIEIDYK